MRKIIRNIETVENRKWVRLVCFFKARLRKGHAEIFITRKGERVRTNNNLRSYAAKKLHIDGAIA